MEQPKKEKKITVKKVGTGSLNGDYVPDLTDQEMTAKKNVTKNSQSKSGNKAIEEIHGVKKNQDGSYSSKPFEKKYVKGDPERGIKSFVQDGTGKRINEVEFHKEDEFRKKFVSDSTKTMTSRGNNADFLNNRISGADNSAKVRRDNQKRAAEKQQSDEEDKKVFKEAYMQTKANRAKKSK